MKKKTIVITILWLVSVLFGYGIYNSVNGPLEFNKVKVKRFAQVIKNMKMIKKSQEAHKAITGDYASDFGSLLKFIDSAKFVITQQRDTSWMEYDRVYRIDVLKQGVVIDTLGEVSVKDSLFSKNNDYKDMVYVPNTKNKEQFSLKTSKILKAGYRIPTFEVKAEKNLILKGLPSDLVQAENKVFGVDEIDGSYITVGSLEEVSTNGNWPSLYDTDKR